MLPIEEESCAPVAENAVEIRDLEELSEKEDVTDQHSLPPCEPRHQASSHSRASEPTEHSYRSQISEIPTGGDVSGHSEASPYGPGGADLEAGSQGYLMLRHKSLKSPRYVPNCCAICLCEYEMGEKVVWSSNEGCPHAFHSECIVDWLTKMQDGTPCPCCRQSFTDLEEYRKERKITWRAGHTFNPSALTFR